MPDILFWIVGAIFGLLLSCLIGQLIGRYRGEQEMGGALGLLLGPLGWMLTALMKDKRLRCPRCGVLLWHEAIQCPACALQLINKVNSVNLQDAADQLSAADKILKNSDSSPAAAVQNTG